MVKKKKNNGLNQSERRPEVADEMATQPIAAHTVDPSSTMVVGDTVEIFGLQGAKELNGRRGRIVAYVEESARFGVRLEGDDETKAVRPANLRKLERTSSSASASKAPVNERVVLERELAEVVRRLKVAEEGSEERSALQKELAELVQRVKRLDDVSEVVKPKPKPVLAPAAAGPASEPIIGLQPPPPPSEQHHPLPIARPREPQREQRDLHREPQRPAQLYRAPPPQLPERLSHAPSLPKAEPEYLDENEYPDPSRAWASLRALAGGLICGIIASQVEVCPATWFIWSFLAVHLFGVVFLTDYAQEKGLLALCAIFGFHGGHAISELLLWILNRDGADSVGPWSIVVIFACILYVHSFCTECLTLPPDYITSISLFFPMFPAFNAAVVMSSLELFVEWRYFPQYKLVGSAMIIGVALMAGGQALIVFAVRTADRNFWASCRNMPEEEEKPEDFVGLEIPNRRIVQEGPFRWERHPAYLGAMLWGVGAEVVLCNPVMLLIVSFVLWASLLYVALEEEQELYDEFKGGYANYCALTSCWIPLFNSFLENAAFQREMSDNCEDNGGCGEEPEEEEREEDEEECEGDDARSEDDLLPTWEGVPRGGALWNRQFREPWILG